MPLEQGNILNDRYRILSILGQGGFGAVYRAADMTLKRPCAVKENLDTTAEAQRQFEKEAIVLAQLSHPNLPRVQDHFTISGQGQYLVMDFIDGEDLQTIINQGGRVDPDTALDWVGQIASALTYLHNQTPPVIHRDIKPANIRVTTGGRAFLVDFGLVKIFDPHLRTTVGARAVTPGYSPPEQYGQGNTDVRTDIYALGATLYSLLTGLEPQESVQRVVEDQLIPVQAANTRVQEAVASAIGRAMDLRPSKRYGSVSEFEQAITEQQSLGTHEAVTMEISRRDMTVQVEHSEPEPVPVKAPEEDRSHVERKVETSKPIWKQPWLYLGVAAAFVICTGLSYAGYMMLKPGEPKATPTAVFSRTPDIEATETSQARVISAEQTQDAAARNTEISKPTDTKRPTLPPTTVATNTLIPTERPTRTEIPTATIFASPAPCFYVIDSWCLTHEGCGKMRVNNATNSDATIHIWTDDRSIDSTTYYPPGICHFLIKPGHYNYTFDYCGEHEEGKHALNQGWSIKFSCP